jgi:hypothetical protein
MSTHATPAQTAAQADTLRRLARTHGSLVAWRVYSGEPAGRLAVEFENGRACVLLPSGLSDGLLANHALTASEPLADSETLAIRAEHLRCAFEAARQAHTHLAEAVENGADVREELHAAANLQRMLAERDERTCEVSQ